MKNLILIVTCIMLSNYASGQENLNENEYFRLVHKADSLRETKNYKQAAINYSNAFMVNGDKGLVEHRYNAACSWAMVNNPDSSFSHLMRIAEKANFDDYDLLSNDPELQSLHKDKRWKTLLEIVKENLEIAKKNNNKIRNN